MFSKSKIATIMLIMAMSIHLSLFGILPFGFKPIGDILMLLALTILFNDIKKSRNDISVKILLVFMIFIVVLIFQSLYFWGDPESLANSRRWIVMPLYVFIITSPLKHSLHLRYIKLFLYFSVAAVAFNSLILSRVIDLAGVDRSLEYQGGIEVIKIFIPGTVIILFWLMQGLFEIINKKFSVADLAIYLSVLAIGIAVIKFRGYWLGGLLGLVITIFFFYLNVNLIKKLFRTLIPIMIVTLGSQALFSQSINNSIGTASDWLQSAYYDYANRTGNIAYRIEKDVSRISVFDKLPDRFKFHGIGFVKGDSITQQRLGVSSETNDSGWVEIYLTSGLIGSIIITFYWILNIYIFVKDKHIYGFGTVASWITMGITMYTSNMMMWDFGFVSFAIIALSNVKGVGYERESIGYRRTWIHRQQFMQKNAG